MEFFQGRKGTDVHLVVEGSHFIVRFDDGRGMTSVDRLCMRPGDTTNRWVQVAMFPWEDLHGNDQHGLRAMQFAKLAYDVHRTGMSIIKYGYDKSDG